MREKDILCDKSGLTVRVLVLGELASWVVDCSRCRIPFMLENDILNDMNIVSADEYRIPYTDEELDAKQKETRDKRLSLISPLLTVDATTDKTERNRIIGEITHEPESACDLALGFIGGVRFQHERVRAGTDYPGGLTRYSFIW